MKEERASMFDSLSLSPHAGATPYAFPQAIVIAGPTASGKTALAIALARRLGTEIISADSMQVYRGMAIGTAAPTREEQALVRHHFVGFLDPAEDFSAGAFEILARKVVRDLNARGRPAVVVGGSGLYLRALCGGLFDGPPKNEEIRLRLRAEARERGVAALYERLRAVDADYAALIGANDLRRIVRALEVHEITGRPLSALHREHRERREPLDAVWVGIDLPRETLYARIDARVDAMIAQGFAGEVRALLDRGYMPHIERLKCLGYREMAAHLLGEISLDEAVALVKRNTRHYAKRQISWFRRESEIYWISAIGPEQAAVTVINAIEAGQAKPPGARFDGYQEDKDDVRLA
ncbi:MAG TPA: tRNA (adenosine(37)-N6)-dimethylallyltransferase MiaA [Candidatus Hydrogenedentes bacterium]|nr:tRNA (adenosine(37)-N6)-dimethylallyltransferase MiaA [Candidatus Hydrogenedentota bacterium]